MDVSLDRLAIGQLYFKIVDFDTAIANLKQGMAQARAVQDWAGWCRYLPLLLRIHAERLEFPKIEALKIELREAAELEGFSFQSSTHYALGISYSYEGKVDKAEEHFLQARAFARELIELHHADFGLAAILSQRGQTDLAIEKLRLLEAALAETLLTDLKLACGLMLAYRYRDSGRYSEAMELLRPLQEICRVEQNLYMSLNVLYGVGTVLQRMGDLDKARQHFQMVKSLTRSDELCHLDQQVEARLQELAQPAPTFELQQDQVLRRPNGDQIRIGSQVILRDLLKVLAAEPGRILGKEELVQRVWKESYDPSVHDNKLYVTIRRLRTLLDADEKESHILGSREGYQMSRSFSLKIV
ncbi:MAG: winged helix-turn-helix domain-containing protein [Bdellovibrionales bacterium]